MMNMKNILIVDDEPMIRSLLSRCLEDNAYVCWMAEDAQQAKDLLETQPVDLLLSDINMPGESGIDLARYVQQEYPEMAIVIMSILDDPDAAKEAFALGVYGYVVKPFTQNIVLISVENALRRQQLELHNKMYQEKLESKVRQQAETLHSQVILLQNLMDAMPCAIFYLNQEGLFRGCNRVFEEFVGKPRSAILGKSVHQVSPEHLAGIYPETDRQLPGRDRQEFEIVVRNASGKARNMLVSRSTCMDEKSNVAGIVGVMLDITERKEIGLALRTSEEKYQQIVDNIDIGVAIINPQMEIIRMNPQMQTWFSHVQPDTGSLCYQSFQIEPQKSPCENCPALKTFAAGKSFETTIRVKGKQRDRYFRDHSSPIHDEEGNIIAVILLVEEVTEKLVLERELRQAQKLEAIGQLAAGIAHEINTPIQYIGDNTIFLRNSFIDLIASFSAHEALLQAAKANTMTETMLADVDKCVLKADLAYLIEEIPRAIEQSLEGVQRVTEIVSAMRDFSHPGSDQKTLVNLNHAINNTVTVTRNEWKYVAELELDLDPCLPEVLCLPGEINQVLLNIIVNAAHAITDALKQKKQSKGKISISTRQKNGLVAIHISDSGTGIPKAIQHRIFDPFFTTKDVGMGTGQGLAIAHRVIIEKHGGLLRFETDQNTGTTFIIELPRATARQVDRCL